MNAKKATRRAYGDYLVELGAGNSNIIVMDGDLADATFTKLFKKAYPDRFFDCGIAEANMVDMAAGLSTMGLIPFVSTFAVFGTGRAYEQLRNGVAYSKFNVKLACTHAGISTGADGGSHQSIEDIALMRVIPGMTVIVPADEGETRKAMDAAIEINGPVNEVALICCGVVVDECIKAAEQLESEGISTAVINMHTIKPLDEQTVHKYAAKCRKILTVEDHSVIGGLGDAVAASICGKGGFSFKKLGAQDRFGQSGTPAELMHEYGIDAETIVLNAKN